MVVFVARLVAAAGTEAVADGPTALEAATDAALGAPWALGAKKPSDTANAARDARKARKEKKVFISVCPAVF